MRWVANSGRHVPDNTTKTPNCDQTSKGKSYKCQEENLKVLVLHLSSGDL